MSSRTTVAYLCAIGSALPVGVTVGTYTESVGAACVALTVCWFLVTLSMAHRGEQ